MDEAVAQYQRALEINPNDAEAHYNLGLVLFRNGQLDKAIAQYQKGLEINPNYVQAHNNLGNALFQKGQLDEAVAQFQKALEINLNYAEAHNNLGIALFQKGQLDEAVAQFQKALEINFNYAEAHSNLGLVLFRKGQLDEAIAQYQKALEIDPNYVQAHYNLGNALSQKGQLDEAVVQFQKALEINPNFTEAHSNLGNALFEKGQLDEAVAQYQRALEINPNLTEAHYNLGGALFQKGQLDEAITQFQEVLPLKPILALHETIWLRRRLWRARGMATNESSRQPITMRSGAPFASHRSYESHRSYGGPVAPPIPDQQTDPKRPGRHGDADADGKRRGCINNLQMMVARRQRHRAKDVIGWHQVIRLLGAVQQCFDVPVVIVEVGNEKQGWLVGISFNRHSIGLIQNQPGGAGCARFRTKFGFALEQDGFARIKERIVHGGKERISSGQDFLVGDKQQSWQRRSGAFHDADALRGRDKSVSKTEHGIERHDRSKWEVLGGVIGVASLSEIDEFGVSSKRQRIGSSKITRAEQESVVGMCKVENAIVTRMRRDKLLQSIRHSIRKMGDGYLSRDESDHLQDQQSR
ncbi:MAG: tetratricopeptide repeat protein [Verrucomicrobia bacterium]|nr:tetratricopeptide repeat protein [Verrucomicrobiota bacterium]